MKSIGLFCAASDEIDSCYVNAAREFGEFLGRRGMTLVYGGAAAGLMEVVAKAVKESGGRVVGVVPQILIKRNRVSSLLDDRIVTENLSDRKDAILANCDIPVALPGGIGTLDELFHVMAAATIGYHHKRVVLYNVNGFWNNLLSMLSAYKQMGFVRGDIDKYLIVADSLDELDRILQTTND